MKIIKQHEDGTVCYQGDRSERAGLVLKILNKNINVFWNSYFAIYRVYDETTGHEIASFRKEFLETYLKMFIVGDLKLTVSDKCG